MNLCILLMLVSPAVLAQDVNQTDTVYFNKNWELTAKKKHKYYRVTEWKDLFYVITDYYAKGQMQYQGTWLLQNPNQTSIRNLGSLPKDKATGTAWFYYKNGNPQKRIDFLPLGEPCDTTTDYKTDITTYFKSGKRRATWQAIRGKAHGIINLYDEESETVAVTQEMVHGLAHGKRIQYYSDDTIYSVTIYVDGEKHGYYTIYYNYPFRPKYRELYEHGNLVSRESF